MRAHGKLIEEIKGQKIQYKTKKISSIDCEKSPSPQKHPVNFAYLLKVYAELHLGPFV